MAVPASLTDPKVIAAALSLGAGALQGVGESRNAEANRQLSREELQARLFENEQDRRLQRTQQDLSSTQLDPLAQQRSRQNNAIQAALVAGARNFEVQAPPDIAPYAPKLSGGIRIPEGGFGRDVLDHFSPSARANAEAQFFSANPRVAPRNLESLGYAPEASTFANKTLANSQQQLQQEDAESAKQRAALLQALQGQQEEKKGGGFGGFLGGLLKTAAPFASFIPGVGPLVGLGLSAAAGALGDRLQGGGVGSNLLSAANGAAGSRLMGRPPSGIARPTGNTLNLPNVRF